MLIKRGLCNNKLFQKVVFYADYVPNFRIVMFIMLCSNES